MKIGLLLPRGAGPGDLSRSGQWSRFARHYLRSYRAAFDNVVLLVEEPVRDLGSSLEGIEVRLLRRRWGRWHADSFSDLDGVRAFQAPDLAAMPGSPPVAAATYGYDYSQFARLERRPWRRLRASRRAQRGARRAALLFTPAVANSRFKASTCAAPSAPCTEVLCARQAASNAALRAREMTSEIAAQARSGPGFIS